MTRHKQDDIDVGRQRLIDLRQLKLCLKVADGAHPAHDDRRADAAHIINGQCRIGINFDTRKVTGRFAQQGYSFFCAEEQLFIGAIKDGHDDRIENARRTRSNIEMTIGNGIEASWIDCDRHPFSPSLMQQGFAERCIVRSTVGQPSVDGRTD
jgi:hypothetical protein